jgi:hypothetical protein
MYTQYYLLFKIKSDLSEDIKGQSGDRTLMNKFEGYPTCQICFFLITDMSDCWALTANNTTFHTLIHNMQHVQ